MDSKVYELQAYLANIARFMPSVPAVIPDGLFGAETAQAVAAVQTQQGLDATGAVDFESWEAIRALSESLRARYLESEAFRPFEGFVFRSGATGTPVYILQLLLREIASAYANSLPVDLTGVYDAQTERAVERLTETQDGENPFNRILRLAVAGANLP